MKFSSKLRALGAGLVLTTAFAINAKADTITVAVYTGFADNSTVPVLTGFPGGTATLLGTMTISGLLNFDSRSTATGYTIGGFITSNGAASIVSTSLTATQLAMSLDNTLWDFTIVGSTTSTSPGVAIHDDGIRIYDNSTLLTPASAAGPTSPQTTTFTIPNTGGVNDTFNVLYAETNGAPGVLSAIALSPNQGILVPTPEPGTLLLLGTGLIGTAGAFYRKIRA